MKKENLMIKNKIKCRSCNGTGNCSRCNGTGKDPDVIRAQVPCRRCNGSGKCPGCNGSGIVNGYRVLTS